MHRATLTTRERVLGPDHPDTLASRINLANALRQLGRHQRTATRRWLWWPKSLR